MRAHYACRGVISWQVVALINRLVDVCSTLAGDCQAVFSLGNAAVLFRCGIGEGLSNTDCLSS